MKKSIKIIISGGGTGGHIYPAISIANTLKEKIPDINILFVGAEGKMEMEKIPAEGYPIIGLPIRGFQRNLSWKNLLFPYYLFISLRKAKKIIKKFQPHAVVGVGGYASAPLLRAATRKGIPALIQEQNSYAGITNKLLARKVQKICVAYEGMEQFFPAHKIILTGNPVRKNLLKTANKKNEGIAYFKLAENKKTLLILGGSLGARTINQSVIEKLNLIADSEIQVIWQTGKYYYAKVSACSKIKNTQNFRVFDFLSRMDLAYAVADVIISRAGAGTISELCLLGKPSILVPSPNVAEDHQTKNALALVKKKAALMIADSEARKILIDKAIQLIQQDDELKKLSRNIAAMAISSSAELIVTEILKMIPENET